MVTQTAGARARNLTGVSENSNLSDKEQQCRCGCDVMWCVLCCAFATLQEDDSRAAGSCNGAVAAVEAATQGAAAAARCVTGSAAPHRNRTAAGAAT